MYACMQCKQKLARAVGPTLGGVAEAEVVDAELRGLPLLRRRHGRGAEAHLDDREEALGCDGDEMGE